MKTSKPISLTVQTQTLTTEEGSQSIETSAYMRNSTSIYKPLNTMPNKPTHFNSSLKFLELVRGATSIPTFNKPC
jgi:hypothetical protein